MRGTRRERTTRRREHLLAHLPVVPADERTGGADVATSAIRRHERGRIDGRLPRRRATRDLDRITLVVEEERDAHAVRARDLLDEPADVLIARLGSLEILAGDLRPDEETVHLATHAREAEAVELERLIALVPEDVVGDRHEVGSRVAELCGTLESTRVGRWELKRAGVGHDPGERRRRH